MAQALQIMIFNDQTIFTRVLVAHYYKLELQYIFLRCVNDIDKSGNLKVESENSKDLELKTHNL